MKNNQKRSPLKKESLRHAGQSIEEKIIDVVFSKMLMPLFATVLISVMAVIEWLNLYYPLSNAHLFFSVFAIIAIIYCLIKWRTGLKEIENLKLGKDGECIVSEALDELKAVGYRVFNDVVGDSFNIDHVVIGPAGVFTVETKTYRKHGKDPQILYDGTKIEINGMPFIKDPIKQAKGQMYWLDGFISNNAKIKVKIRPVVVFPGWFVSPSVENVEVWVLNQDYFVGFLKNSKQILSKEQINLIADHLESYIRNN